MMMRFFFISFLLFTFSFSLLAKNNDSTLQAHHINGRAQGTTYHITYYSAKSVAHQHEIDSIFAEIDESLSIYKPNTLISRFNNSTSGVYMDKHLKAVVIKSKEIFKKSGGLFDITIYPLVELWGFGTKKVSAFPDSAAIATEMKCVGSEKIRIVGNRLIKDDPCVKINLNAIAPGYTSDLIASFLEKHGVKRYVVEVGGEVRLRGKKPNGSFMNIGIEGPAENSSDDPFIQKVIQMKKGAITTAGNYRQYIERGDQKVSHLLDGRTGYPLNNELISVTVIAKDAMTADGFDNVLMGLGLEKALQFVKKQKNMEAYFIYQQIDGPVADTATTGFNKLLQ